MHSFPICYIYYSYHCKRGIDTHDISLQEYRLPQRSYQIDPTSVSSRLNPLRSTVPHREPPAAKMKIFNWMHRRFHHSLQKDGFDRNVKKPEFSTSDQLERQALLKQVAFANVFNGWRDDIFTIGTFDRASFDPPKITNPKYDYLILQRQEDLLEVDDNQEETYSVDNAEDANNEDNNNNNNKYEEEEEEEMNPLMFTTFDNNFDAIEPECGANVVKPDVVFSDIDVPLTPFYGSSEIKTDVGVAASNWRKNRGERVTLVDLFSADSDIKKTQKLDKIKLDSRKLQGLETKNGLSIAKKLIPLVGEDPHPIKRLNHMLNRKIHPEHEGKAQNLDGQVNATELPIACESVALLPTPAELQILLFELTSDGPVC